MLKISEPSLRQRQVSEVLRRLVSSFLLLQDSQLKFLVCSRVLVSRDLKISDVFFRFLGSKDFESDAKEIDLPAEFKTELANYIKLNARLRHTPIFRFYQDRYNI